METREDSGQGGFSGEEVATNKTGHKRPRRRLLKIFILLVLLAGVLPLVVLNVASYIASVKAGDPFEAARKAGIPVSFEDPFFRKWDTQRPTSPEENAAIYYEEAFAAFPPKPDAQLEASLPVVGKARLPEDLRTPIEGETLGAMRDYVQTSAKVFESLDRAAAVEECYFPITWGGMNTIRTHWRDARTAARMVVLKMLLEAEDQQPQEAARSAIHGLALGRALAKEPGLISGLVAAAIDSVVVTTGAERVLSRTDPSDEDLLALQNAFFATAEELSFRPAFIGEIAYQHDFFGVLRKGQLPAGVGGAPNPAQSILLKVVMPLAGSYITANEKRSLRFMLGVLEIAENPTPETVSESYWAERANEMSNRRYIFCAMLLPALARGIQQCEMTRARLRAAAASCAAMRYRNDNGNWPESLDALVPTYLDKTPLDPFTGKPLLYATGENGIMIYSVGPNQADDGGRPYLAVKTVEESEETLQSGDDVGFQVLK